MNLASVNLSKISEKLKLIENSGAIRIRPH